MKTLIGTYAAGESLFDGSWVEGKVVGMHGNNLHVDTTIDGVHAIEQEYAHDVTNEYV